MPREWVIEDYTGFEGLKLQDCEKQEPGPTDVRLRIEAFALNWGDDDLMHNRYSFSFSHFPARVGIEAAGIVEAIGSDVVGVEIGARYSTLLYYYDMRGVSAETTLIDQDFITKAPPGLSAVESASIWMQYMTAYYPIAEMAAAGPGVNILAPAGTSTAGAAAIEIAKLKGANVITTTRSEANRQYLIDLGADHVFVDQGGDIEAFILEATEGVGAHASFDPVGGDFMDRYAHAMAPNGKLMLYGGLAGSFSPPPYAAMFQKALWYHAYSVFNHVEDKAACARGTAFIYKALEQGALKPRVDKVFLMEDYIEAWRYLKGPRKSYGKVVIETGAA